MKRLLRTIIENAWTLIDDTLKRDKNGVRRFSKTALTMFTAWILVIYTYITDFIEHGFRSESFVIMVAIATGMKTADAISKKLNKDNNTE